jgi:hypothetical protein
MRSTTSAVQPVWCIAETGTVVAEEHLPAHELAQREVVQRHPHLAPPGRVAAEHRRGRLGGLSSIVASGIPGME